MRLLYRRCAGLDVHKKSISVCVRIRRSDSKQVEIQEKVFGTFTQELDGLRDWLQEHKVKQVAMESTGATGYRCGTFWSRCAAVSSYCW